MILLFFQTEALKSRIIKSIQLSRVSKYLDITKGFTRESAILSTHSASYNIAYKGGHSIEGPRTWVCNGPWAPSVDEVRFFLGKETLEFLNRYVENYDVGDPMIFLNNFTCVNYDVDESSVISRKNDEKFDVGAFGSEIKATFKEDNVTSKNEFGIEIARVRFWYMYRIFRQWAETTTLPQDICNGLGIICGCPIGMDECSEHCPSFLSYSKEQVEKARQYLESLFNDPEYIECSALLNCCRSSRGSNTDSIEACIDWELMPCGGCAREIPDVLCGDLILKGEKPKVEPISIKGPTEPGETRFLRFNVGVTIYWKHPCLCKYRCPDEDCPKCIDECGNYCILSSEPRGTITATFSCVDKKYSLSI
ncbi:MAG: hypothetical protein QMD36_01475 [Candidatus Aenigmarchaeota archaeon]|nr:hypothetical protein [Candidatus Aenigmarchaeota archaeon]